MVGIVIYMQVRNAKNANLKITVYEPVSRFDSRNALIFSSLRGITVNNVLVKFTRLKFKSDVF